MASQKATSTELWHGDPLIDMTAERLDQLGRSQLYNVMTQAWQLYNAWWDINEDRRNDLLRAMSRFSSEMTKRYGSHAEFDPPQSNGTQ